MANVKISELNTNSSPSTSATLVGVDNGETVQIPIGALGSNSEGASIIDVVELPTQDINESAFYRKLTGTFVYNKFRNNTFTCYCVETLPEVGEPATNADMSTVTAYYSVEAGNLYGYVDAMLSYGMGVPVGWYEASMLFSAVGIAFGGVVTSLEDAVTADIFYLLLEYVIYSYKDGWASLKPIGRSGTAPDAEVFNHISNIASDDCAHAEGYRTTASGCDSHAEGCETVASGENSHAEGAGTTASGLCSHAEGDDTIANRRSQHVQGEYNIPDEEGDPYTHGKYAHIVGNGWGEDERSNAHTLDWNGNAWYQGDVYTGGTGQDDTTAKKLATEDYVDDKISSLPSGGSSGGGASIIDIEEFPSNPSTSAIYRKWQVIKAEWTFEGHIVTDGGMTCEVVDTLPETGEMCYTETSMYSYYCRADNEVYGYVDSNLSAMMSVPVGWYPAATLFGALGYTYNGIVESIENVSANGYCALLTKKPHLYCFHDNNGNIQKSAIITNDNYEFDEATGTLTQHIIL